MIGKVYTILDKPPVKIFKIVTNCFLTNTYVVVDEDSALIVDPGFDREREGMVTKLIELLEKYNVKECTIVNTHGHLDHFSGNIPLKRRLFTRITIAIHEHDAYLLEDYTEHEVMSRFIPDYSRGVFFFEPHRPDLMLRDGDSISLRNVKFTIIHCPGHTRGSIVLHCPELKIVITGDMILDGGIGRVDLPHSNVQDMVKSVNKLLNMLPPSTLILPGHGSEFKLEEQISVIMLHVAELTATLA